MSKPTESAGLLGWLRRNLEAIDLVFCKLNRIQFDAPWRRQHGRC